MGASVLEGELGAKDQVTDGPRGENLTRARLAHHPGRDMNPDPRHVVAAELDLPGVQPSPTARPPRFRPRIRSAGRSTAPPRTRSPHPRRQLGRWAAAANRQPPTAKILAASVKGVASRQIDQPGVHTAETLSTEPFLSLLADETGTNLNSPIEYRVTPLD